MWITLTLTYNEHNTLKLQTAMTLTRHSNDHMSSSVPRPVCLTPVTVRRVRTACVLPFPAMSEPVLLKEFFSLDGGAKPAVSFASLCLLKMITQNTPRSSS